MGYVEIHLPGGQVQRFDLSKSSVILGRSPQADITVNSSIISRRHARFQQAKGRWILRDLGSRNKTYYNKRPIKARVLNNEDVVYFGSIKCVFHDPTGHSDKRIDKTVYLDEPQPAATGKACPACKSAMADDAVVCVQCGFNVKTGKRIRMELQGSAGGNLSATALQSSALVPPEASTSTALPREPQRVVWWQLMTEKVLPASFLILLLAVSLIKGLSGGQIAQIYVGLIFRVSFMMTAMALAARIGDIDFGNFYIAILRVFGICAALTVMSMLAGIWSIILYFVVLIGLLKLFFDLDPFEWFLVVAAMFLVEYFLMTILIGLIAGALTSPG